MTRLAALLLGFWLLGAVSAVAMMRNVFTAQGWDTRGNATFAGLVNPPWSGWQANLTSGNFARVTADVEVLGNQNGNGTQKVVHISGTAAGAKWVKLAVGR